MSVVGFDIGNESCVIAAVKQRGVDVLLNNESKRETPSIVCFGEKQRFLGSAAAASSMMNPKSTVSQVKRLIGRNYREHGIHDELKKFPFVTSESPDGSILIHLQYLGETHTFTPVQVMGMLFVHLKDMTKKNLETPVCDCVIGIPSYFTELQRRAYLNAATIAGLKPLRLMHDCTATALSYGIYKTDFSNAGPIYVAFVDIGHCDTQVCIAAFEVGYMRILSHAFDRNLGGWDFDEVLFNHFAALFKEQYNIDICSNVRASIRLRVACEKLKKVLSANAEAHLSIECLMDEKDVKGFIKREEFENLACELFNRISVPCNQALADAGLTADKIHSVELVGSGSRIPALNRLLACIFKREPSRTLNASECVARGCALQCAMLSPVFRVREYEVQDSFPFSIGISSNNGPICTASNGVLYPKGQPFPSVKILTFQRSDLFQLEAFYAEPNGLASTFICFTIGPLQVSSNEKSKIKVNIHLNLHGILTVESATLLEDLVDYSVARGSAHANVDRTELDGDSPSDPTVTVANGVDACRQSKANGMRKDKTTGRIDITVRENVYGGMTRTELLEAQKKEMKLGKQDRAMEQTKDRKNALEAYVYDMRNKLFSTFWSFASDSEREGISRSLQETEEWLYDDGDDETEIAYASRLEDLKKLVDPIENRYKEEEARSQATRDLLDCIVDYRMSAKSYSVKEREMIINECNKAEQWVREKTKQQDSLPKNSDPVLLSTEIKMKLEELNRSWQQLLGSGASPSGKVD